MRAEWITMTKVGDVRLVQPLAGRDGPSRGHFLAISPWTEPTSSETYSKNLNPSSHRVRNAYACFLKRTRPRAERADGQPLARLTPGFLPLTAMSVP